MKALVTGFDPFGDHAFNPSIALLRRLRASPPTDAFDAYHFLELPTEFDTSRASLITALQREKPDMTLMFGLAASTPTIRLERVALNLDDAEIPDNAGKSRAGTQIIQGAPLARMTSLDLAPLRARLNGLGFEVVISNHAGAYVCNHVYYAALHHQAEAAGPPALFVHLPAIAEPDLPRLDPIVTTLLHTLRAGLGGRV